MNTPVQPTQPIQPVVNIVPVKKSNKKLFILIGVVFLIVICFISIGIGVLVISNQNSATAQKNIENEKLIQDNKNKISEQKNIEDNKKIDDKKTDDTDKTDKTDTTKNDSADTYQFKGKYLTAKLPNGWKIKEFSDINGMHEAYENPSTSYSGLTGFHILDEYDDMIFYMEGIDGIGGGGGCSELVKFKDTQSTYVNKIVDQNQSEGFDDTNVIVAEGKYSEYNFLGLRMRRLDNSVYVATESVPEIFNTACGINAQVVKVAGISFDEKQGDLKFNANLYSFGLNTEYNLGEEMMQNLDVILNTLKPV